MFRVLVLLLFFFSFSIIIILDHQIGLVVGLIKIIRFLRIRKKLLPIILKFVFFQQRLLFFFFFFLRQMYPFTHVFQLFIIIFFYLLYVM